MLNYIVLVNKRGDKIVIDYESKENENDSVEIGYKIDCGDWDNRAGIYKIEGYLKSDNNPETYVITDVTKISDISY